MATSAQLAANQANAQKSTGPRTVDGKAASARNHTSHGLCSQEFVVEAGHEAEFETFMTELRHSVQPDGALEFDLFTQFAHATWTLRRCRRAEVHIQKSRVCSGLDPLLLEESDARLRNIEIYNRRAERAYYKALAELKRLQSTRVFRADMDEIPGSAEEDANFPLAKSEAINDPRIRLGAVLAANRQASQLARAFAAGSPLVNQRRFEQTNPIPAAAPAAEDGAAG